MTSVGVSRKLELVTPRHRSKTRVTIVAALTVLLAYMAVTAPDTWRQVAGFAAALWFLYELWWLISATETIEIEGPVLRVRRSFRGSADTEAIPLASIKGVRPNAGVSERLAVVGRARGGAVGLWVGDSFRLVGLGLNSEEARAIATTILDQVRVHNSEAQLL